MSDYDIVREALEGQLCDECHFQDFRDHHPEVLAALSRLEAREREDRLGENRVAARHIAALRTQLERYKQALRDILEERYEGTRLTADEMQHRAGLALFEPSQGEPSRSPFRDVTDDLTGDCGCACHTGVGHNTSCAHCLASQGEPASREERMEQGSRYTNPASQGNPGMGEPQVNIGGEG